MSLGRHMILQRGAQLWVIPGRQTCMRRSFLSFE